MYGDDAPWLWRGQANAGHLIEPALHTRMKRAEHALDRGYGVSNYAGGLIQAARKANLDRHEGTVLPDLALLALLQHHGAATPLLDVSLDPMVALYMAVVSPNSSDEQEDGALFAIKRPTRAIGAFDSREFLDIYDHLPSKVPVLYSAPDVSERLRIQRGHFLLGTVYDADPRVTIPLTIDPESPLKESWIWKRMSARGSSGKVPKATTDVAVFRIASEFKRDLRSWLEARSGLTHEFVYPTVWHQPHLVQFAVSHGRRCGF